MKQERVKPQPKRVRRKKRTRGTRITPESRELNGPALQRLAYRRVRDRALMAN